MFGHKYRVIEVDKERQIPLLEGDELRNALVSLQAHPGFIYLVGRLRAQRNGLEARLKGTKFEKLEDITFIQGGIFWTNWLSHEVDRLTEAPVQDELPPSVFEDKLFREIDSLLERVGEDANSSY